jgi:type II secretory pathway component PulJ
MRNFIIAFSIICFAIVVCAYINFFVSLAENRTTIKELTEKQQTIERQYQALKNEIDQNRIYIKDGVKVDIQILEMITGKGK